MLLFCSICGRPWKRVRDGQEHREPTSCPHCRFKAHSLANRTAWKARRRRLELRREAIRNPATAPLPSLETLMDAADSAASRALELAARLARK